MLSSLVVAAGVLLAQGEASTTIEVTGPPKSSFTITCEDASLGEGGEDGVYQPPGVFTIKGGHAACELVSLTEGPLTVEVHNNRGTRSRLTTAGANSTIRFNLR